MNPRAASVATCALRFMLPLASSASTIDTGRDGLVEGVDRLLDAVLEDEQIAGRQHRAGSAAESGNVNSIAGRIGGGFGAKNPFRVCTTWSGEGVVTSIACQEPSATLSVRRVRNQIAIRDVGGDQVVGVGQFALVPREEGPAAGLDRDPAGAAPGLGATRPRHRRRRRRTP